MRHSRKLSVAALAFATLAAFATIAHTGFDELDYRKQVEDFVICDAARSQHKPAVACDSTQQQVLTVWEDYRPGPYIADIYGQRVSLSGSLLGGDVAVCFGGDNQYEPDVAYNGRNGEYLAVWHDGQEYQNRFYIRGQRVSRSGELVGSKIDIAVSTNWQINPSVAYNSRDNEYLVVWEDGEVNVVAQRLSRDGALLGGHIIVSGALEYQSSPEVAYNRDRNEYLVVWHDFRNNRHTDIWGQRLSGQGGLIDSNMAICTANANQSYPTVSYGTATNRYLVAWHDYRHGQGNPDIYGQLVSDTGSLWGAELAISRGALHQMYPDAAFNEQKGAYLVVWSDNSLYDYNVFGQLVSYDGALINGNLSVCTQLNEQRLPAVASLTGTGSWFIAWEDRRDGEFNIYGRVYPEGPGPTPTPTVPQPARRLFLPVIAKAP